MAQQSDRVVIKLGPGRLDKDVQREIDDINRNVETKQPAGPTETVIPGGGGYVIDVPPGSQFAYVPMNLVTYPIDLNATYSFRHDTNGSTIINGRISIDIKNVLGYGTDTLIAFDDIGDNLVAFNNDGSAVNTVHFDYLTNNHSPGEAPISGFFSIDNYIVSYSDIRSYNEAVSPTIYRWFVYTYDGTNKSYFELTPPPAPVGTTTNAWAPVIGPSGDNSSIIVVWHAPVYDDVGLIHVHEYSGDGTFLGGNTKITGYNTGSDFTGKIENGWVVLVNNGAGSSSGNYYYSVFPAEISSAEVRSFAIPIVSTNRFPSAIASCVSENGVVFVGLNGPGDTFSPEGDYPYRIDVIRYDYDTDNAARFYGAVFNPLDPTPVPVMTEINWRRPGEASRFTTFGGAVATSDFSVFFTGTVIYAPAPTPEFYYYVPATVHVVFTPDETDPSILIPSPTFTVQDNFFVENFAGTSGSFASAATLTAELTDGSIVYLVGRGLTNESYGYFYAFRVEPGA